MALYDERKAFYDTKTSCFGSVMLSGTFLRTITLTNKLTLNTLEAKAMLCPRLQSGRNVIDSGGSSEVIRRLFRSNQTAVPK